MWMCPECGHGSADLRDERAHLDAHRQLRAFFREWEAGTGDATTGDARPARRLSYLGAAALVVVTLLASISVYSRLNGEPDAFRAQVPPPAAVEVVSPLTPPVTVPPSSGAGSRTRPTASSPAPTTAPRAIASPPSTTVAVTAPAMGSASPTVPGIGRPAPAPPPHLLSVCLLGICLDVL